MFSENLLQKTEVNVHEDATEKMRKFKGIEFPRTHLLLFLSVLLQIIYLQKTNYQNLLQDQCFGAKLYGSEVYMVKFVKVHIYKSQFGFV